MQVVSIFIAVLAVSRFAIAQSQSGYNYPSPFNPLAPGASGDLGGAPGLNAQQPTAYPGSQPGYNNQPFTPSGPQGPPSFGATPTLTPGFNQQPFVQPAPSSLPPSVPGSHSSIPGGHSSIPGSHSSVPGSFGPSASAGFPATSVPSSKGFESSFPHSGSHSGGHSGTHSGSIPSSHSGPGIAGASFPGSSSGFPGSVGDSGSAGFGAPGFGGNQGGQSGPGFSQGQPSFGGQGNNFGQSGSGTQFQGENDGSYQGGDYSAIPGNPGADYPIYTEIPKTSFDCKQQQFPGYYADVEAQCQVFHICALNTTFNFLCPNGTIFSQEHLVCVWWNQFDCNSAPSLYGNNAYIYDYSKTGQSQEGQGPSRNFGNAPDGINNFDGGAQGPGFGAQGGSPGFGASQPGTGFGPSSLPGSPGFGTQSPSSGFGPSAASAPAFNAPSGSSGFGPSSSGAPGFGSSHSSPAAGYPSSSSGSNIPSSGFGQPASSHTPGFGQSHIPSSIPSGGSSHHSSHNVPSSHSFPSQSQSGAEQYPIVPPSQTDYQSPVIVPTIPSSPAPFGIPGVPVTGYPPAGTPPSPSLNPALAGEQPSREYLPQRRTK